MTFPQDKFADILSANSAFSQSFVDSGKTGQALRGLAVVTCIDSRIDPLRLLGMQSGDAKIVRNAGARVTEDVLRTLVLATHLLNVDRILVMPHTDCKMASAEEQEIHSEIKAQSGVDTRSLEFRTVKDQEAALKKDVDRVRAFPLIKSDTVVAGAIYDVHSGQLQPIY